MRRAVAARDVGGGTIGDTAQWPSEQRRRSHRRVVAARHDMSSAMSWRLDQNLCKLC
jgi:hypothetical protein